MPTRAQTSPSTERDRLCPTPTRSRTTPPQARSATSTSLFVAAAQNPTRGVVIAALTAFAFSFYVALWLAFPQVALLFTVLSAVVVAVLVGVYVGFGRLSR
jgi:uncharacterized membrane protein